MDMDTKSRLEAALMELAKSESVRGRVGKGRLLDECECPVARYLKMKGCGWVHVNRRHASADDGTCVELPSAVKMFVWKFDNGEYPELIEQ
jgi:hypothetical protein